MNKFAVVTGITAVLALLGVTGAALYENHETNKKVGKSMDELKNATVQEISESLLKEAVTRAANIAVDKYVGRDNDAIMSRANGRLDKEITSLVNGRYSEVTRDVSDRLAAQVSKMDDPERLRKAVRERAEELLMKRLDDDLDDLKRRAEDAFDDANERYEDKLSDVVDKFEEKLDDELDGYSENLASMKKVYESIERAFGGRRSDREGKEIRFTLG